MCTNITEKKFENRIYETHENNRNFLITPRLLPRVSYKSVCVYTDDSTAF